VSLGRGEGEISERFRKENGRLFIWGKGGGGGHLRSRPCRGGEWVEGGLRRGKKKMLGNSMFREKGGGKGGITCAEEKKRGGGRYQARVDYEFGEKKGGKGKKERAGGRRKNGKKGRT